MFQRFMTCSCLKCLAASYWSLRSWPQGVSQGLGHPFVFVSRERCLTISWVSGFDNAQVVLLAAFCSDGMLLAMFMAAIIIHVRLVVDLPFCFDGSLFYELLAALDIEVVLFDQFLAVLVYEGVLFVEILAVLGIEGVLFVHFLAVLGI
ncbi:unnamed protein product [Polarella glacialis]|uniref:Uncharacterized protein n=1 Tax=Polarella glacialis TaxID=89957 RepID=A0A813J021_POLGL|nr:unnamed protein product [Polarella glacialis]